MFYFIFATLNNLTSIEPLNKETITDTFERPIIVHCNDLNLYYIKYSKNVGTPYRLFNEYLAAWFLPIWEFNHSNYAVIKVRPEDLPDDLGINKNYFNTSCFGVQIIEDSFDLTHLSIDLLKKGINKTRLKADLLKLAFFDIWLCNEDRHQGNLNILAQSRNREYLLYPIDHIAIYNQLHFAHPLVELTYDECLIGTKLFSNSLFTRDIPRKAKLPILKEKLYLYHTKCAEDLDNLLAKLPLDWNINKAQIKQRLLDLCFNDDWFNHCWDIFVQYLQIFQN